MAICKDFPALSKPLPPIPDSVHVNAVTEGCVDGNGIYDVFMKTHMDAIHQEYAKQRIKGSEYSQVYLGGIQAAMQNAVGFALGKDEASAKAEAARWAAEKAHAELLLTQAQLCKIDKEIELLQAQREMTAAQTWAEIAKTTPEINVYMKELLDSNYEGPIAIGPAGEKELQFGSVLGTQIDKAQQEEALLKQKTVTEHAQTENGPDVGTAIYKGQALKQRNLLQRQADGFVRDAESTVAKIRVDAHNIEYSTLDGEGQGPIGNDGSLSLAEGNVDTVHSPDTDL